MSDLFGNHIIGFPTRRLISCKPFEVLYFGTLIKYSELKSGLCQVRILSSKVNITAFANEKTPSLLFI